MFILILCVYINYYYGCKVKLSYLLRIMDHTMCTESDVWSGTDINIQNIEPRIYSFLANRQF